MLLKPGHHVPELNLPLARGGEWNIEDQSPENFLVLLFYRGYHCPACKEQLEELNSKIQDFSKRGIDIIAISMDSEERVGKTIDEWDVDNVPIAYNLDAHGAARYNLYLSAAISEAEPKLFSEPGTVIIRPDRTVYAAYIQSVPFARPHLSDLLKSLDFVMENDYPARGTAS